MPDITISGIPLSATALSGSELFEIEQGGVSKKAAANLLRMLTPKGSIDGLKLEWVSGTSLRVTSGSAYIQSLGYAIDMPAAITKSSLSLTASTWYHVYLFDNAGTPDIEIVITAPASAYSGTARSKSGDTSRRYLGSVLTDGSAAIINFLQAGMKVAWQVSSGVAPFRVLSGGLATTTTSVDLSAVVPVTSRLPYLRLINLSTNAVLQVGNSSDSTSVGIAALNQTPSGSTVSQGFLDFPCDASQQIDYQYASAPSGSGAYIDVYGYTYER